MDKQEVIDLIKDTAYGCLATIEDNQPRVRPMSPYLDESGNLLVAIISQCRSIPQIKKNPLVEICYVDRKMCFARISGKAKINDNPSQKELVWNNLPMLRQYFSGPEDPTFVLVEIDTDKVEAMSPHQNRPDVLSLK
ncbi:MAG: pyridoxamine 5'-phosphate oxidase family protein [Candidatus Omnitrophota bacterium]